MKNRNRPKTNRSDALRRCAERTLFARDRVFRLATSLGTIGRLLKGQAKPEVLDVGLAHLLLGIEQELSDLHTDLDGIQYGLSQNESRGGRSPSTHSKTT